MLPNQFINQQKNMGACCDLFEKDEIFNNQSRIKMLETKVQVEYHTENDSHFTYYLHYFHQHQYLEKMLREQREAFDKTQDSNAQQFDLEKIEKQYNQLTQYLEDCQNKATKLSERVSKDVLAIVSEGQKYPQLGENQGSCMVKLEIQGFKMVQGITRLKIIKSMKVGQEEVKTEESILVNMYKMEKVYRELCFATLKCAKIMIVTEPVESTVTMDVQDIMKHQAICSIFKFQNKDQDFGFVALRMQFVTNDSKFNSQRKQKLYVLQKQLKTCLITKSGLPRSSISQSDSHRNTFISDHVSQYQNEYQA